MVPRRCCKDTPEPLHCPWTKRPPACKFPALPALPRSPHPPQQMKPASPLLMIPFREVRHDQPDDVLHYEPINVRGKLHQWTIPAHRHESLHQFQLLMRGAAQATLDGETLELAAPAALMIAPGVVHGFVYARDSVGHQVTMPSEVLRALLAHAPALQQRLGQPIVANGDALGADAAECESLFLRVAQEFGRRQPGRAEALHSHAVLLGLWFLRREATPRAERRSQALRDTLVQRFRALLEQHFRAHEPVRFYAARLGVTADHLSRICRATSGAGALELVHERVLLEARRLLAYSGASVADIAHDVGFDDPGYFSRFFVKLAGQSPSAYRAAIARGIAQWPVPDAAGKAMV